MTPSRILTLVCVATVAGCSTASSPEQMLPSAVEYEASSNVVKTALLSTFNELGVTIDSGDPGQGLVRTQLKQFDPKESVTPYMECGGDPALGPWTQSPGFVGQYVLNVRVDESDDGKMSVLVRASMSGLAGSKRLDCASTGSFERDVLAKIDEHMKESSSN